MAITKSNRQSYYPPISPNPTAQELALHLKNLYTAANNVDSAVDLLSSKVNTNTSSIAATSNNTSTLVTKTIVVSQLSGLGGVNDQTGSTSYTPTASDAGIFLIFGDTAPVAVTLNSSVVTPYIFFATNYNTGIVTFTPSSGLINGAASWVLPEGGLFIIGFDGTNWKTSDVLGISSVGGLSAALALLAPIASPTFTGVVTQPDATVLTAATTAATATAGTGTLPAAPQLFLDVTINSTAYRIPLYLP